MMKKLVFLTIFFLFTFGAIAQNVTIKAINRPASEVFRSIMEQTDKNFVYSSELLKDMRITVDATKKPLKKVLDDIFRGSDIKYEIKGKNVILKKQKKSAQPPNKISTPKRQADSKIHISDSLKITMLEPLDVISQSDNHPLETAKLGVSTLNASDIRNTPAVFGEPDLIKTVQVLPGVSESTDGVAGMNVHGGNADENLYLLDKVPLYQVEHFAGLFSPFNTDIIRQSDFYRTSIPARYDGRLSSVLDVQLKNGSRDGHHGSARLGLTAGAFNISGPIGNKTTYLVGLRRSWYDILTVPIMALVNSKKTEDKTSFRYHFMDFNAKVEHRFSDHTSAFINAYYGDDLLKTTTKDDPKSNDYHYKEEHKFNWGNFLIQGGVNHKISQTISSEFSLAYTRYFSHMDYDIIENREYKDTVYERDKMKSTNFINTLSVRSDFTWHPADNSTVRFGASYARQSFLPDRMLKENTFNDTTIFSKIPGQYIGANSVDAYIEDDWKISDKFHAEGGVHASLFNIASKNKWGLSPRLSFSYSPSSSWAIKAAYSRTVQYVHRMDETYLSLPCDRWVPAIGNLKPMTADKIGIGTYWQTKGGDYSISMDAYYKFMHNLIDFRDEYYLVVPADDWNSRLTSGKGTAKGVDLTVEKKTGRITGSLSYSLAWSDRQFADRNGGHQYPARFDHRHTIKAFINWEINDKVSLNALWTGHSGNHFTLLPQRFESPDFPDMYGHTDNVPLRANVNNYQLPFYHRLDLACNVKNRHGYWSFSIYNAYCNMNTIAITSGYKDGEHKWVEVQDGLWADIYESGKPVFQKLKLIPIIPSVSYTWLF